MRKLILISAVLANISDAAFADSGIPANPVLGIAASRAIQLSNREMMEVVGTNVIVSQNANVASSGASPNILSTLSIVDENGTVRTVSLNGNGPALISIPPSPTGSGMIVHSIGP